MRLSQPSKALDVPQAWELSPGREERFLRGIGGIGIVEQDRPGEPVAAIEAARHERVEGGRVAMAGALHERVVGRRRLSARPMKP